MFKNEILIIGSGFAGSVLAREFSEKTNLPITVIEKRNTVGGNMYDEYDKNGILIQKYGPHIVFTDDYSVIEYLNRFSQMVPHDCKMFSFIDGHFVHLPYCFKTIQEMYPLKKASIIIDELKKNYSTRKNVSIYQLIKSKNEVISSFGNDLFDKAYRPYIAKQWNKTIDQIDKTVVNRVKFQLSYTERYLQKDFQFFPLNGFTKLIQNILNHERITVITNTDAIPSITFSNNRILFKGDEFRFVFFTGAVDELFSLKYGRLPYRSMLFNYEYFEEEKHLPCEICSFPSQSESYIRKTEYKFFAPFVPKTNKTVVVSETPVDYSANAGNVQCYPVINVENKKIYEKYKKLSKKYSNLVLIGRLAKYQYFNMDQVINDAIATASHIIKDLHD